MVFTGEGCSFRTVSELEWGVIQDGKVSLLPGLARDILRCRRRRECGDADCCTILGAGMLVRFGGPTEL